MDMGSAASTTSLNLMSNTMFSVDLADLSHDTAREFRDLLNNVSLQAGKPNLADYFPVLAKIDPQGADTTSSTIEWAMAELLHNPEKLKKAKVELEQTIGKRKLIQESDISQLPYLRAIVKETMRFIGKDPSIWKNVTTFMPERFLESEVDVRGQDFELIPFGAGRRMRFFGFAYKFI
ncbi:hypothetical protein Vadar_016403 [Vaccinium darrowii]|uniref:Uncharacterized protein n=1 Tax=Vaccinium darrowii TaxID=229202 RepID=A0ACB7XHZ2_9ERIC|nr:hypothetical protein Vadar_016403 [Vaccinium darrowii]